MSFEQFNSEEFEKFEEISINGATIYLWQRSEVLENNNSENLFCIMQTSGSTGKNKIIKIPYECIRSNTESLRYVSYFTVTF